MAYGRELYAYLVLAACEQVYCQQRVAFTPCQHLVFKYRFLALRGGGEGGMTLVVALGCCDVMSQGAGIITGRALDYGKVRLVYLAIAEHLVEPFKGFARLGENHEAAHGAVYAVYYPAEHVAGLGIFLLNECLDRFGERLIAGLVSLYNLARGLVDYYYMVILINRSHVSKLVVVMIKNKLVKSSNLFINHFQNKQKASESFSEA